jgi:hypothetical protein
VGTCIGARNYRYFFLFVTFCTLVSVAALALCIVHLVVLSGMIAAADPTSTSVPFFQAVAQAPAA